MMNIHTHTMITRSAMLLWFVMSAHATSVTLPYTFTAGSPISASQMMGNFASITSAMSSTVSSPWVASSSNIYFNAGSVGIGSSAPTHALDVGGSLAVAGNINILVYTQTIDMLSLLAMTKTPNTANGSAYSYASTTAAQSYLNSTGFAGGRGAGSPWLGANAIDQTNYLQSAAITAGPLGINNIDTVEYTVPAGRNYAYVNYCSFNNGGLTAIFGGLSGTYTLLLLGGAYSPITLRSVIDVVYVAGYTTIKFVALRGQCLFQGVGWS